MNTPALGQARFASNLSRVDQNERLREVIDFIGSRELGRGDQELFRPIVDNLLGNDPFFLLADYQAYIDAQEKVSTLWHDEAALRRKSILNTARMGKFASDRSIRDYCERIQPGSWIAIGCTTKRCRYMVLPKWALSAMIRGQQGVG